MDPQTPTPRRWVAGVPYARALALGCMTWALVTIYYGSGGALTRGENTDDRRATIQSASWLATIAQPVAALRLPIKWLYNNLRVPQQ